LNNYAGTSYPGHTADFTCNGDNSCPNYPQTDDQGRVVCCFPLPQASNGITALSSVTCQNTARNINNFQVNIGKDQSFNSANDLSVFVIPIVATVHCNIILPIGTIQPNNIQFRLTWTYHPNSNDNNVPVTPAGVLNDVTLPVKVLRVTSTSAFVQQGSGYNEWFVCPPSTNGQISALQSIALLSDSNVDYFRCIYVNKQGIPMNDPNNGNLLLFTSTKNSPTDNPAIANLPNIHTDCLSIQYFPSSNTSFDPNSILLGITIAFQTMPTTTADVSSVIPQVSHLQGTFQIQFDVAINLLPQDNNNGQISPTSIENNTLIQCTEYDADIPMSYDSSTGKYTGTFEVPPQNPDANILDSITVNASSNVQNPINAILVDSQGNMLSPAYSLTSGIPFPDILEIPISKVILQATASQDAPMDSLLDLDVVMCPANAPQVIKNISFLQLSLTSI